MCARLRMWPALMALVCWGVAAQAQSLFIDPAVLYLDADTNDLGYVTVSRDTAQSNITVNLASGNTSVFTLFGSSAQILNGSTSVQIWVQAQGAGITTLTAGAVASGYAGATSLVQVTENPPVTNPPNAVIQSSRVYGSPPLTAVFNGTNSTVDAGGTVVSYTWDFGDGSPAANGPIVTNVYSTTGMFTAELIVLDSHGLSDTSTVGISVFEPMLDIVPPLLSLELTGDYVLGTVRVVRTGGDIRSNLLVNVSSGDTDLFIVNSPIYITAHSLTSEPVIIYGRNVGLDYFYASATNYPSTQSIVAISYSNELALLTAVPTNAQIDQDVVYTATPLSPLITNYVWDFDGDSVIDSQGPGLLLQTSSFPAQGIYTSSLVVMDSLGAVQTSRVEITVTTNLPPVAVIDATPDNGNAPLDVELDGSASYDSGGGSIVSYAWDADGDGGIDSTDIIWTNTYGAVGIYTARLDVVDNAGLTGSATRLIYVGITPSTNNPPVISFLPAGNPKAVIIGDPLQFWAIAEELDGDIITLTASNVPSGASYSPNPDSGSAFAAGYFDWTPNTPGNYAVNFYASDKDGTDQVTLNIIVADRVPESYVGLYITEYVEGSNQNDRAIVLYNRTGGPIPAGDAYLQFYYYPDAAHPSVQNLVITNTIPDASSLVVVPKNASTYILNRFAGWTIYKSASQSINWFNGNDAIVLRSGFDLLEDGVYGPIVDSIGQIDDINPGGECQIVPANGNTTNYWGTAADNTRNHTMNRRAWVTNGWTEATFDFNPATQPTRWSEWTFTDEDGGGGGPTVSNFWIKGFDSTNAGQFAITFESTNGQSYVLETVTNLLPAYDNWSIMQGMTASDTISVFTIQFTNNIRFYRIRAN